MKDFFQFLKDRYCRLHCGLVHNEICRVSGCKVFDFKEWINIQDLENLKVEHNMINEVLEKSKVSQKVKRTIKLKALLGGKIYNELQS